eukprot:13867465-Heterocapsa_arctica.AAC.1
MKTVKGSCHIGKKHRIMLKRHVVQKWKYHKCTGQYQEASYIELISDRRTMSIVKLWVEFKTGWGSGTDAKKQRGHKKIA